MELLKMTLEEQIKKMLAEAASEDTKQEVVSEEKTEVVEEQKSTETVSEEVTKPATKKTNVSEQVAALLEVEGLSGEFKTQAVTIFEAAVADRAMQIEEELTQEYQELFESEKAELINNIDGFLNEAVQTWIAENEVAIKRTFKTELAESFMDGLAALLQEHNVVLPDEAEDVLETTLENVEQLEEALSAKDESINALQEQINVLKAEKILESFKEKMTNTEFDRFTTLVESVKFTDEVQYEKQLTIVLENFSVIAKQEQEVNTISEEVSPAETKTVVTETAVNVYANYLKTGRK